MRAKVRSTVTELHPETCISDKKILPAFYGQVIRLFCSGGGVVCRHFVAWVVQNEREAQLNTAHIQ